MHLDECVGDIGAERGFHKHYLWCRVHLGDYDVLNVRNAGTRRQETLAKCSKLPFYVSVCCK